jgi:hypothetical protein
MTRVPWWFVISLVATPAAAQTPAGPAERSARPPRVEVAGGVAPLIARGEAFLAVMPTGEARVRVFDSTAVSFAVSVDPTKYGPWFYTIRLRGAPPEAAGRARPFVTVGTIGRFGPLGPKLALGGGGGASVPLARRLSLETGVELWVARGSVAFMFQTMLAVPIGRAP